MTVSAWVTPSFHGGVMLGHWELVELGLGTHQEVPPEDGPTDEFPVMGLGTAGTGGDIDRDTGGEYGERMALFGGHGWTVFAAQMHADLDGCRKLGISFVILNFGAKTLGLVDGRGSQIVAGVPRY